MRLPKLIVGVRFPHPAPSPAPGGVSPVPVLTARLLAEETTLRRNTLRKAAFLHTVPPRWQPRSKLDEGRVARRVVDPSIGRSGQRVGKHRHGPVHLRSRLLPFESGTVLVDPGRDEGVRVE